MYGFKQKVWFQKKKVGFQQKRWDSKKVWFPKKVWFQQKSVISNIKRCWYSYKKVRFKKKGVISLSGLQQPKRGRTFFFKYCRTGIFCCNLFFTVIYISWSSIFKNFAGDTFRSCHGSAALTISLNLTWNGYWKPPFCFQTVRGRIIEEKKTWR